MEINCKVNGILFCFNLGWEEFLFLLWLMWLFEGLILKILGVYFFFKFYCLLCLFYLFIMVINYFWFMIVCGIVIRVVVNYDFFMGVEDYVYWIGWIGWVGVIGFVYIFFFE